MLGILHWTKDIQYAFLFLLRGVWAKKDRRLVSVNLFPLSRFIAIENVDKLLTLLVLHFTEKETVISKEEMSDYWAPLTNGHSTNPIVTGNFMNEC